MIEKDAIGTYYDDVFLKKYTTNNVKFEIQHAHVFDKFGVNAGIFTLKKKDSDKTYCARFTFVFEKQTDDTWKIIHHHMSRLPDAEGLVSDGDQTVPE